jgi:hypothetical protein
MERISLKLVDCWELLLLKLFVAIGKRKFGCVAIWAPGAGKTVKAIHFAINQREFNISIRTFVERLDQQPTTQKPK